MAVNTIDGRVFQQSGSATNRRTNNPILGSGQLGVETDTGVIWTGDGVDNVNDRPRHQPVSVHAASADVTMAETDDYTHVLMNTGGTDRTLTLPPAAQSKNRIVSWDKVDSGAGKLSVTGNASETINGQGTIDFEEQYSGGSAICDGSEWIIIDVRGCQLIDIDGTLEAVYKAHFKGVSDADSTTNVAHGQSDSNKIVSCWGAMKISGTKYKVYDSNSNESAGGNDYELAYDDTNIIFDAVGSSHQSAQYRATVEYYI